MPTLCLDSNKDSKVYRRKSRTPSNTKYSNPRLQSEDSSLSKLCTWNACVHRVTHDGGWELQTTALYTYFFGTFNIHVLRNKFIIPYPCKRNLREGSLESLGQSTIGCSTFNLSAYNVTSL